MQVLICCSIMWSVASAPASALPSDWKEKLDPGELKKIVDGIVSDANLKSPDDYQFYEFGVVSTTPPQQHGRLRGSGSPFPIVLKPNWFLIFINATGNWTMKKASVIPHIISPTPFLLAPGRGRLSSREAKALGEAKGDGDCDAKGYPTRWATASALCEYYDNVDGLILKQEHAHFGQLILCGVKEHGNVYSLRNSILGERYAYLGDYKVSAVNLGKTDETLLPFFNDRMDDNGKHYENNDGSLACKLVVINGNTLIDRLKKYFNE